MTVARYAALWTESRRALVSDWRKDEARLRLHVLGRIGETRIDAVRPRHLVYNVYGLLKALFRDARIADLITSDPCVLTKYQLGEKR